MVVNTRTRTKTSVPEARSGEYEDLLALLMDSLSVPPEEGLPVAEWVAASCLGEDHLWQDMGLENRGELSGIIDRCFEPLFRANIHDMKWKKFFYRKICEREGFFLCKSPSCGECVDYDKCFGNADDGPERGRTAAGRKDGGLGVQRA